MAEHTSPAKSFPRKGDKYIALRRQSNPGHEVPPHIEKNPKGLLFFCHNLIRYGESIEQCVKRIVKDHAGVNVTNFRVVDIETEVMEESGGKPIKQWAIVPHIIAEVDKVPEQGMHGNEITEVVTFTKENPPTDFAWWNGGGETVRKFLEKHD